MKGPNILYAFVIFFILKLDLSVGQKHYQHQLGRDLPQVSPRKGYSPSLKNPCEQKSCYPATGNLLIGRERQLWASSTCGVKRREKFCIVSHLKDSKKCFYCESNERTRKNPKYNHEVRNIIYKYFPGTREESWWQSENGKENVTIQLDLEAEFHFTHLIIVFKTFRPAAMLIERSYDFGKTWQVYRYFASDCRESFPGVASEQLKKLTDVICESRYSKVSPSTGGEVIFRVLPPQMYIANPYTPEVQNLLKMTNLRINFTKLHTLGDDLLDNRAEIQEKYYYAITNMVVRGSCSCYGHASNCLPLDESESRATDMVHGRCACVHNTKGANCEECENFYNDLPWQPAIGKQSNACQKCNCNNHTESCHFDAAVFQASGNISGGVCDGCGHNTMGTHCEMCKPYYYLDPTRSIQDPDACLPCDCDPNGSLDQGICDSHTDEINNQEAGSCHCKLNVEGRRCDTCKNGFWNFTSVNPEGCQACTCNTLGTINNQGCDINTGECTCKRYVTGRDCNQCLPEFWGLSDRRDGCLPCDCDSGGAIDNMCDVKTGQCRCRENVQGRKCDQPKQYYYARSLEHNVYEAEDADGGPESEIIIREPFRNGRENTWTGTGFKNVPEGSKLKFYVDNLPRTMDYDTVIRYEPKQPDLWENAVVHIIRPEPLDPSGPCANTKPSDDNAPIQFRPSYRSVVILPPTCLEKDKSYEIEIELKRYKTETDTPSASILIDSLVLIPRIDRLPVYRDPHMSETRYREIEKFCKFTYKDVLKNDIPDVCKKYHMSTSFEVFSGAYPCNCDDTGSISKLCSEYGGFCQCKPRVVGRQCDRCAPGTYGFGPEGCKACDCSGQGSRDNFCDPISGQCKCKNSNTYGRQCDQCRPGFWKFPNCQHCECNGHADTCDSRTGACINCRDSTTGHNCEQCVKSYYGDPRIGIDLPCRPCPCPGPIGSDHSHADSCALEPTTRDVFCECHTGYAGYKCDICADNYFGHPELPGGACEECDCNNNIDIFQPGNCNATTGQCLRCLFNTEGDACEHCKSGFYGDAVVEKNCRECICDMLGTDPDVGPCDRTTGQCPCKKNVIGLQCNECKLNHWRIALGNGCEPCDCDPIGSLSEQCNVYDGHCDCKPGFGGRRCNQCTANHWGNPTVECFPCDCDPAGSKNLQCNQTTGACICNTGISGAQCNVCDKGFLGVAPNCEPCGECFTNWNLILDQRKEQTKQLIEEVKNTIQVGTPGAYTQEFDSMENSLKDVEQFLSKTSDSLLDAQDLQNQLDLKQKEVDGIQEYVDEVDKRVNDITTNITIRQFNLDELKPQAEELKINAEKLHNNATSIQEGNVELALALTEKAKEKVDNLVKDVAASRAQIERAEQNCNAAESLVNRTKQEKFDETKSNLNDIQSTLDSLLNNITSLNDDICDRKGVFEDGKCDSICGGAGCGFCGSDSSCDEGAIAKQDNADKLAKEATKVMKNKELKSEELLRNLSQINADTVKAHDEVTNAYNRALETNRTASSHLQKVEDTIEKIKNLNTSSKNSPKELQELVHKIFTLKITSKPEDIEELADKITKAVTTLTDIDAILHDTEADVNYAKELHDDAIRIKNETEKVFERASNIRTSLVQANVSQADISKSAETLAHNIGDIESNLETIAEESEVAKNKADESVIEVENLNSRLKTVQTNFLKNQIDAGHVEAEGKKIVREADRAKADAEKLQLDYSEANKSLANIVQYSQNIKDRANKLFYQATQLNENITNKINYLNELSLESREKEQKLKALSSKLDGLNAEMDQHLANIRSRSSHYRICSTF